MKYFESDVPSGNAFCSDNDCPCSDTVIPRGTGYLYIEEEIVRFRKQFPKYKDAYEAKRRQVESASNARVNIARIGPILVCERGARLRKLDLDIAAADAKHWWETGQVALRATPKEQPPKLVEIEAQTLEEARKQARSQIPQGFSMLSETVISDGNFKTIKGIADTTEAAYAKAKSEVPKGATIFERKDIFSPSKRFIEIESFEEVDAKIEAHKQTSNSETITNVKLIVSGKSGFLGIGKKPSRYEVEVCQQAVVEVTYKTKAKISIAIAKQPTIVQPSSPPNITEKDSPLDAILILFNRAFDSQDQAVESILTNMHARGRAYRDWMTPKTQIRIQVVSRAEDSAIYMATALVQFRIILEGKANLKNVEVAQFSGDSIGVKGVILTHWSG